jgi:hypothetical protein
MMDCRSAYPIIYSLLSKFLSILALPNGASEEIRTSWRDCKDEHPEQKPEMATKTYLDTSQAKVLNFTKDSPASEQVIHDGSN